MFCPFCGVKNEDSQTECFVCNKKFPWVNGGGSVSPSPTSRPRTGPQRLTLSSGPVMARLGDRLIALILDTIFIAAVLMVASAALLSQRPKVAEGLSILTIASIGAAATLVLVFLYHWLLEGAFGATMGKAIIGVKVTRFDSGRVPGLAASAVRNALRIIDALAFYLVGFFVAVFSRGRRRIGDYAANTVVLEHAVSRGERITVTLIWVAGISAAVWGTWVLCPAWFQFAVR